MPTSSPPHATRRSRPWKTGRAAAGPARSDAELGEAARQAVRRSLARVLGFKPVTTSSVLRLQR